MARAEGQVEIDAPPGLVFDLFTNLERWPQWMSNIKSVLRVGENLTQWIAVAQSGEALNWLAETVTFEPGSQFAWRSVGGDLDAAAQATFTATDHDGVFLRVSIEYDSAGEGIVTPFGYNPAAQLSSDLKNFRRMVEQEAGGEDETLGASSAAPRVTAQLEPEFLKQNQLLDAAVEPNKIKTEEAALESDFGRALEDIKRRTDKIKTPVAAEPPAATIAAAAPAAPTVATKEVPSPAPAPPPATPKAKLFVAPSPPDPPQRGNHNYEPTRPSLPHAVSYKHSGRGVTPVYWIFALAAFLGALAGFWLASARTAAVVEAPLANTAVGTDEPAAPPAEEDAPTKEAAGQKQEVGVPPQTAVETQQQQQAREQGPEPLLRESLADWIATTNARDMNRLTAFYMPVVDTFYQKSKVKRAAVRAEKVRVIERADVVRIKAAQPTVKVSDDGNRATMRFRKTYVIESKRNSQRGEVLQELVWQKTNTGWKIISERDLRVIR